MSLNIGQALREGFSRTFQRNGLVLVAVFIGFGLLNAVVGQSLSQSMIDMVIEMGEFGAPGGPEDPFQQPGFEQSTPLAIPLSVPVALGVTVLLGFVAEGMRIVSIRVFASDVTTTIPDGLIRRNLPLAVLNGVVGGILVTIAILIGLVLVLVPGVFLAISFFFLRQEIAIEDKNFIDALSGSWELTSGNRFELLGLMIIVFVVSLLASAPNVVLAFLSPEASTFVGAIIGGFTTVFSIAVATRAYQQLRAADATEASADAL